MKKKILAALLLLPAFVAEPAAATDVYVYRDGSYVPINVSENICKMMFSNDSTYIITNAGDTARIADDAYTFLLTRRLEVPTGINSTATQNLAIKAQGGGVHITAPATIERVTITDAAGTMVASLTPRSNDVFLSLSGLPAGVYIVKAACGTATAVSKISKAR